jgi:RNA polymerase sigma factor, sigma-70 family
MQQEQFKQEVLPLRKKLLRYAQRMLDDVEEAEDVIQEVYLKLWNIRDKLLSYDSIIALSSRITKNLCINHLRVRGRTQESLDDLAVTDEEPEPDVRLEQKDNVEHVMRLIDSLPKLQQSILRMRHVDGFEIEEIAQLTGSNVESIRVNLSRARKKVREQFFKI